MNLVLEHEAQVLWIVAHRERQGNTGCTQSTAGEFLILSSLKAPFRSEKSLTRSFVTHSHQHRMCYNSAEEPGYFGQRVTRALPGRPHYSNLRRRLSSVGYKWSLHGASRLRWLAPSSDESRK